MYSLYNSESGCDEFDFEIWVKGKFVSLIYICLYVLFKFCLIWVMYVIIYLLGILKVVVY